MLRTAGPLPGSICGLWLAWDDADLIVVDDRLRGPRRDLVVLHETGHLLFGHVGTVDLRDSDAGMLRYDEEQEWQAEWLATYLLSLTRRLQRRSWLGKPSARYTATQLHGWG